MAMVAATTSAESSITLDTNKCIQMALVHDLAEATVGDITPHCGVSDEEKHKLEKEAMENLCRLLPISNHNIQELWKEYEDGVSEEAKLVKDLDKLEMILQALEYEKDGKNGKSLDGFFDSTRGKWRTSIGQAWGEEIEARRAKGTTATIDETKPASSVEPAEKKQKLEK